MTKYLCLSVLAVLWFGAASVLARDAQYDQIQIVPASNPVTVDGDLKEWDLSGAIEAAYDPSLLPNFVMKYAMMYDAEALYIGAHFTDANPMKNAHDPAVEPAAGWDGDALQVRMDVDPAAPYPLNVVTYEINGVKPTRDPRINHLTFWYHHPGQMPVLMHEQGMTHDSRKVLTGPDSGVVYKEDADGKGYTLETRIPWKMLCGDEKPPKAGDKIALTVQPLWSKPDGSHFAITYYEVIRGSSGYPWQGASVWGRAVFSPTGHLKPQERPMAAAQKQTPLKIEIPLADPKATMVSSMLFDSSGKTARTLPVVTRQPGDEGTASVTISWDGLDDFGNPLPAGNYTAKVLSTREIGQKFVASVGNSGNPPWTTDDGTGKWGGDWEAPTAAATDGKAVYLSWGSQEAGPAIIRLDPTLTPEGKPQKKWGTGLPFGVDLGASTSALTTNGTYLFVAVDGPIGSNNSYMQFPADMHAGIIAYDCETGKRVNFPNGKPSVIVSNWKLATATEWQKPLFELRKTNNFGRQNRPNDLAGIKVSGDMIYCSLFYSGKVVALNWKTGKIEKEYPIERPSGIDVDAQGRIVVAHGGTSVSRIDPASGRITPLIERDLTGAFGLNINQRTGEIYISDRGSNMQVRVYSPEGKLLRKIGKDGGRAWVGTYDKNAMLMPANIAVDAAGKLWVPEYDDFPRRVSVWQSDSGKLIADFQGPAVPQCDGWANRDDPTLINTMSTLYHLDYATGHAEPLSTLWRPFLDGWTITDDSLGQAMRYVFRKVNGRTYVMADHGYADNPTTIFLLENDRLRPITSVGLGYGAPIMHRGSVALVKDPSQILTPEQVKTIALPGGQIVSTNEVWHTWIDSKGDGLLRNEDLKLERPGGVAGPRWCYVDENLTFWGRKRDEIYRVPVKEWTAAGVPLYPDRRDLKPLFKTRTSSLFSLYVDNQKQRVYTLDQISTDANSGNKYASISCYDFQGNLVWAYGRNVYPNMAIDSPFWKPGYFTGGDKFAWNVVKVVEGVELLAVPGYWGNFQLISTDGNWVAQLCHDNRYGPVSDQSTIWIENMTVDLYQYQGKTYLMGGDIDRRIWEITGLDSIRTSQVAVALSESDHALAVQASQLGAGASASAVPLKMGRLGNVVMDGDLKDWTTSPASLEAEGIGSAKIYLGYDQRNLYVAFDVAKSSPMKNGGTDPLLAFKTGDCCDLMIAADPSADPNRKTPTAGDTRLLFTEQLGKPVCVIYQAVAPQGQSQAQQKFTSPTGAAEFERVAVIPEAKVVIKRSDKGYVLEAAVPLSSIGLSLKPGMVTRGDVGVLFSNQGGVKTVRRAYISNKDTSIVEDVPTEARLAPQNWTSIDVE